MRSRRARRAVPTTVTCAAHGSKSGMEKQNGERIV
jgi:hypothetical protein